MTHTGDQPPFIGQGDDEAAERLLRMAGPRPPIAADRAARVRTAVHARWQAGQRRRLVRRRVLSGSALVAAAAVLVLLAGRLRDDRPVEMPPGADVAVVERVEGAPQRLSGSSPSSVLAAQDVVRTGEWIETGPGTRIALRFTDGTSVRLDAGSRLRSLSPVGIELAGGAVYVDTGRESGRFEVRTPIAVARDVGTQFEVRLVDEGLRLRVRTGMVELRDDRRSVSGRGGTEVLFSEEGAVSRAIAVHGAEWAWIARLSPPLDGDGIALSVFLDRLAREQGWTVRYADADLAREAESIILHGSVEGLTPEEALEVVVTTSGLRHRLDGSEAVVTR